MEHADKMGHVYKERMLKPSGCSANGAYLHVHLSNGPKAKWHSVHRLVADAFCEKKPGCDIVNHLDNNPANNEASNLEWTTYAGNMQWAAKQGRMKGPPREVVLASVAKKRVPVIAISPDGERITFPSQAEAARSLGILHGHIAEACRGEYGYKTIGGYKFEYADESRREQARPKKVKMDDDERRKLLSERMKGNQFSKGIPCSEKSKQRLIETMGHPVIQYSMDMEFIKEYPSCSQAQKETGVTSIPYALHKSKKHAAGGYIWRLKHG